MSRPDLPCAPARPTLFGAATAAAPDAPLRMLRPEAPPGARPPSVFRVHRRSMTAAAVLGIAAAATVLAIDTPERRPPALAPVAVARSAAPAAPSPAPAVIESIAPTAAEHAPPVRLAALPPANAAPRAPQAAVRPAPRPHRPAAPARAASSADADVDLLAAVVARLEAGDPASAGCAARGTPRPDCVAPHGADAVSRAAAR